MTTPPKYKVGDIGPEGVEIALIYGQAGDIIVYQAPDKTIMYYLGTETPSAQDEQALERYDYLSSRIFDVLPRKAWIPLIDHLASALYNALTAANAEIAKKSFDEIEQRVIERTRGYSVFIYWLAALAAAVVLAALLSGLYAWYPVAAHRIYALYLVFAVGGSLASVMLTTASMPVGTYEQPANLAIRAVFRIIIGVLFAAFFVAGCKANLIAGIAASTPWAFAAFSFVSGFSERFVPEILTELGDRSKSKKEGRRSHLTTNEH